MSDRNAVVEYLDETDPISCPYGDVRRVVTGGAGGVANVHIVQVTKGTTHYHEGYDEVYYVLEGVGSLTIEDDSYNLRPGAVAVIPRGTPHSLEASAEESGGLKFIIFGTPAMPIDDDRAARRS